MNKQGTSSRLAHDGLIQKQQPGQWLLIDADDTLWENSIYFEKTIADFISYLDHRIHTPSEVREHLNLTERATIAATGYGLKSFRASLTRCLEDLLETEATSEQHVRIGEFVDHIGDHEIELLNGVRTSLTELAGRHTLMLVTKGNREEQLRKLENSGLAHYFNQVEVLIEKDEQSYRELCVRYGLPSGRTWMIGNSPRSDINPAIAAGLNAVLIPHEFTWVLEHESITSAPGGQTLVLIDSFEELTEVF